MKNKHRIGLGILLLACGPAWAASPGADDASAATYGDGWASGDNGGAGFGAWTLVAEQGAGFAGCFTADTNGNNTLNYIQTGPDGKAWGLYANGDGANLAAGFRAFADGVLVAGQSVGISMENRYIAVGGTLGFTLRAGNATGSAAAYATGARFHWGFTGGSNNYFIVDGSSGGGQFDTGVPWTENGLQIRFSLKTTDTYDLEVVRLGPGGGTSTFTGRTLAGSGGLQSLAVYANNVDVGGADGNVYFNSLSVSPANLILNGDFEQHGGSWNSWANWLCWGNGALEQGYSRSPTTCARTWAHDSGLYQNFAASPGVKYVAEAYLLTPTGDKYGWNPGSNTYACVRLEFKDSGGVQVGSAESDPFTPDDAPDAWTSRSVTLTAPANTAYGCVVLGIRGAVPGAGTVAYDDARVTVAPPPAYTLLPSTFDGGGGRTTHASGQVIDASIGGPGGTVSTSAPAGKMAKHGYAGQLYDLAGLSVTASPPTIAEGGTRTLEARPRFDDDTVGPMDGSPAWSIVSGPLKSVVSSGPATAEATASNVYQNVPAVARADREELNGSINLTVLNIGNDDYGAYSNDGVDDGWQVSRFGLDNPQAAAGENPDGDWPDNLYEFVTGTDPTNKDSYFTFWIEQGGTPPAIKVVMDPAFTSRIYAVEYSADLPAGAWSNLTDGVVTTSGTERAVGDPGSTNPMRMYRARVTYPWQ